MKLEVSVDGQIKGLTDGFLVPLDATECQAEVAACLKFLNAEYEWEAFRADMLYHSDEKQSSHSRDNCRKLKNYLAETGHGIVFLREFRRLQEQVKQQQEEIEMLRRTI